MSFFMDVGGHREDGIPCAVGVSFFMGVGGHREDDIPSNRVFCAII